MYYLFICSKRNSQILYHNFRKKCKTLLEKGEHPPQYKRKKKEILESKRTYFTQLMCKNK